MIGNRLKLKRQANRLSLQELADLLEKYGVSVTKGALSNYETGKAEPGKELLALLCQTLGISEEFLQHEDTELDLCYFTEIDMVPRRQAELDCYVACQIERRIDIDGVLGIRCPWKAPERMSIASEEDLKQVSEFAERIRSGWGLYAHPISSVTHVLEQQGWDVYELPEAFGLPGVCGYDRIRNVPFLYYPTKAGLVNVRMQILCLAASAYLEVAEESLRAGAYQRFARTVLMTREQAISEFGESRTAIAREELEFGKNHYGLPKYEIMSRLLETGIIDESLYCNYMSQIQQQGYPSARGSMAEPLFFYENSTSYKKKVGYAYAEGLLGKNSAILSQIMPSVHKSRYN